MEKIQERADEFAATGFTEFRKWELLTWFSQERITKNIWRNINDHLEEKAPLRNATFLEMPDRFVFIDDRKSVKISDMV